MWSDMPAPLPRHRCRPDHSLTMMFPDHGTAHPFYPVAHDLPRRTTVAAVCRAQPGEPPWLATAQPASRDGVRPPTRFPRPRFRRGATSCRTGSPCCSRPTGRRPIVAVTSGTTWVEERAAWAHGLRAPVRAHDVPGVGACRKGGPYPDRRGCRRHEMNGSTTNDRTNYYEVIPRTISKRHFWLESTGMGLSAPRARPGQTRQPA